MKKTVVTLTGIRPDFIRMAEIFRKLDAHPDIEHILIHSGQHFSTNLSEVFFEGLKIRKPDYNLNIGAPGRRHYEQQAILGPTIISLLRDEKIVPDVVLFLGDSNSALASIPLKKEGIPIGHIEAGMRSSDEWMPEEVNRICCDHVSNVLFAYHQDNLINLVREGIEPGRIHVVGNTIVEIARPYLDELFKTKKDNAYILVDIHRHENVTSPARLNNILELVGYLSRTFDLPVRWIGFARTLEAMREWSMDFSSIPNVEVVPPVGYKEFMALQYHAAFMVSDSGTAQEEPALLGTPVIVPRSSTERPQSLINNCSIMADVSEGSGELSKKMLMSTNLFLSGHLHGVLRPETAWLGDGTTSEKIVRILVEALQ